jgi:hypothetical protein
MVNNFQAFFVLRGKGHTKHTLRKVTFELVYQTVDEQTTGIISEIKEIKKRQEDDIRYL